MSAKHTTVKYKRPHPLLKAGSNLVVLGIERQPPLVDCYVIAAENLYALEQQREELLVDLKKYGRHSPVCCHYTKAFGCNCGFDKAIAKAGKL